MTGLSDYDVMRARLVNLGRWGRYDPGRPKPTPPAASIYSMGRANRQGEGDDDGPADAPPTPIDHADAELLDAVIIGRLAPAHRITIRRAFYLQTSVYRLTLDEAIRAVIDADG